jgi:hypothetical protein
MKRITKRKGQGTILNVAHGTEPKGDSVSEGNENKRHGRRFGGEEVQLLLFINLDTRRG